MSEVDPAFELGTQEYADRMLEIYEKAWPKRATPLDEEDDPIVAECDGIEITQSYIDEFSSPEACAWRRALLAADRRRRPDILDLYGD